MNYEYIRSLFHLMSTMISSKLQKFIQPRVFPTLFQLFCHAHIIYTNSLPCLHTIAGLRVFAFIAFIICVKTIIEATSLYFNLAFSFAFCLFCCFQSGINKLPTLLLFGSEIFPQAMELCKIY